MSATLLWIRSAAVPHRGELLDSLRHFTIYTTPEADEGIDHLAANAPAVVLAEFPMPGCEPAQLLERIRAVDSAVPVIIHDPAGTVADAVRLVKLGAYHFLTGPLDENALLECLEGAVDKVRWRTAAASADGHGTETWKQFFVGESRAIGDVEHVIRLAGPKRSTVLITGETGTGKEVVARALHLASPRASLPMIAVNCSALPENLLEAELFGHTKGAFTGAVQQRVGRFEQADKSTLFLDEIGELPIGLQAKLLRVLQEREFQRVGSSESVRSDVRILAASNADLKRKVSEGTFREDLYYRLNVVPIHLPPLRERASDIPLLAHHFLEKICGFEGIEVKRLSREALDRLCAYAWPGNVRQLENAIERAVVLSGDRLELYAGDFPLPAPASRQPLAILAADALPADGVNLETATANYQRMLVSQAMERSGGNKTVAAHLLRMKRTTLLAKLRTLDIQQNVIALRSA